MRNVARVLIAAIAGVCLALSTAAAHDGWIQSNVASVAIGDLVYIDMQFGNHGNTHRDYKIWPSKWDTAKSSFLLHTPNGELRDMEPDVVDIGMDEPRIIGGVPYVDRNGYLVVAFPAEEMGFYIADVEQDTVVSYAPERSIKSAKAIVRAVPSSMGRYGKALGGYDQVLGQWLEVVPLRDPTTLAVGDTLLVQIRFKGEPLPEAHVSVIPRGKTLPLIGTPNPYDLMTDIHGVASFTFLEANYHLIVVHHYTDEAGTLDGKTYTSTKYTGALTVIVRPGKQ